MALKRGSSTGVSTRPSAFTAPSRSRSTSKPRVSQSMTGPAEPGADGGAEEVSGSDSGLPPVRLHLTSLPLSDSCLPGT